MSNDSRSLNWRDVDSSENPRASVNYLDTISTLDTAETRRHQIYELLHVQPGQQILDIGCGAGDDVCKIAHLVGVHGRVVGVDISTTLIQEAHRRAEKISLPVEFYVGDVEALAFSDNVFDGCCANRVFMHLSNREQALLEMIRISCPGGWIVIVDPDWDTLLIDTPDSQLTRLFVSHCGKRIRHTWCGRQLLGLCKDHGLVDVICVPHTTIISDYTAANKIFHVRELMIDLVTTGEVSEHSATKWLSYLEQANREGRFFCTLTMFIVAGRKPIG